MSVLLSERRADIPACPSGPLSPTGCADFGTRPAVGERVRVRGANSDGLAASGGANSGFGPLTPALSPAAMSDSKATSPAGEREAEFAGEAVWPLAWGADITPLAGLADR